jgi:hypothetical protein
MTFIVRVLVDDAGGVTGIVERVQTGQKNRFEGIEAIGQLIAGMLAGAGTGPGHAAIAPGGQPLDPEGAGP